MLSEQRLDGLRERNKDLLNQLKLQGEELGRLCGRSRSGKREREDGAEGSRDPAEILTDGDRGPARAALAKPRLTGPAGFQHTIPTSSLTSKLRGRSAECTTPSACFRDDRRHHNRLQDERRASAKSCSVNHSKEQSEVESRVSFHFDASDRISAPDEHHLRPLLGYDWIAGVLDAEDSLLEYSDEFFSDLRTFRLLNKEECVHSPPAEFSEKHSGLAPLKDEDSPEANMDTHQCTFSYRINNRLFPSPLHPQERCLVCKKHKSSHPHTAADPALIRVNIPRSVLLPPYKYKAHRRCSFDPSDSLGLPSHCLSGWSNRGQSTLPPPSSLDLRSSLITKNSTGTKTKEEEVLSVPQVSGNQIPNMSRLTRHKFQHFSSPKKPTKHLSSVTLKNY